MDTVLLSHDYPVELELSLPYEGKVLVRAGQEVKAGDLIAEASFPARYQFFDLIKEFGIKCEDIPQVLQRQEGDALQAGDLIAWKQGLVSRFLRASEDGALILARNGRLTIAYGEKKVSIKAPYDGVISEIITGKGARLANQSMVMQGAHLIGKRSSGPFVKLSLEELLEQPRKLDKALRGAVLWLDGQLSQKAWDRLKNLELAALVLASAAYTSPIFQKGLPFTVFLLMGAGEINLDEISRSLLDEMLGMIVILEPKARSGGAERPVLFRVWDRESHPLQAKTSPVFEPGAQVRLLGKPYHGLIGTVLEVSKRPESFASGVFAPAAVLRVGEETQLRLPVQNLELILS